MVRDDLVENQYGISIRSLKEVEEGTDNYTRHVRAEHGVYYLKLFDEAHDEEKRDNSVSHLVQYSYDS